MNLPNAASLAFLAYVLMFLPWIAFRNRGLIDQVGRAAEGEGEPGISRTTLYVSTLISLSIVLILSVVTGRTFDYPVFAPPPRFGAGELAAAFTALAITLGLMHLSHVMRPPAERRAMVMYRMLPRTRPEWAWYTVMCLMAGAAEEAAYRGVAVAILSYSLGSLPAAVLISAGAFAVAHAVQGWKSGVVIFAMALCFQALVWYTGSLVVAMVVHAVYDLIAGGVGVWRIRTGQVDAPLRDEGEG